jgi:uncharacterized protein
MLPRLERRFFHTGVGFVVLIAMVIVSLWAVLEALKPLPGRNLTLATGPAGSTYASVGERYKEILSRHGVQLKLLDTNGALDNVRLLIDPRSGVGAGFIQAGTINEKDAHQLASLGTVFYEAVWLFCRCSKPPTPAEHAGWRLSTGSQGSADRPLVLQLLALNGIDSRQLHLYAYRPEQAALALRSAS